MIRCGTGRPASLTGTSAKFPLARQWKVARGVFFSDEDERDYATVAVLGQTVAKALFQNGEDPLGQFVLVNNLMFQVIGVMAPRGASPSGQDQDDVVLVPYATSQLRLSGQRFLRNVTIAVEDVARIDQTQAAVEALLAQRHGTVDFQIRNMASIIDTATDRGAPVAHRHPSTRRRVVSGPAVPLHRQRRRHRQRAASRGRSRNSF